MGERGGHGGRSGNKNAVNLELQEEPPALRRGARAFFILSTAYLRANRGTE